MTDNKYWLFLERLRKSGVTNMYGSPQYLMEAFGLGFHEAVKVVNEWMKNYNPADYRQA